MALTMPRRNLGNRIIPNELSGADKIADNGPRHREELGPESNAVRGAIVNI